MRVAVPLSCIAACPGCGGDTVNLRQIGLMNCVAVCFVCAVQSLELVLTELLYWKGVVLWPFDALPLESASLKITQHLYLGCFVQTVCSSLLRVPQRCFLLYQPLVDGARCNLMRGRVLMCWFFRLHSHC